MTHEPYKSHLLPLWRFRNASIAKQSSTALFDEFLRFYKEGDFVGMDMCRKFLQLGIIRTRHYANYKGGRKYDTREDGTRVIRDRSAGHEGQEDKLAASKIFAEATKKCWAHEGYKDLKGKYQKELKDWIQFHCEDMPKEKEESKGESRHQSETPEQMKQEKELGDGPRKIP
ncbi:hypothetical protein DSL72_006199 [Monilinia vaccinii-corymbosi]|uniref:Uncharacterized protein n=1 Tax=Monilinia vaccinii-corymbosi TaxID=61207 RepID=A0A8A3PHT7_9HELO|nr:hypothetical protein DSL72_006199 [Monilinia vaccinii-corymbosi]